MRIYVDLSSEGWRTTPTPGARSMSLGRGAGQGGRGTCWKLGASGRVAASSALSPACISVLPGRRCGDRYIPPTDVAAQAFPGQVVSCGSHSRWVTYGYSAGWL